MTLQDKLDKLPAYMYCGDTEDCDHTAGAKHYLNFNKDIRGKWSVGYVEFETHTAIYTENEFDTLEAATDALLKELAAPTI